MKKTVWLFSLLLVCTALFCGCSREEADIYYLNFKPEAASVYTEIAKAYKEETGIDLRVVTAASGTYEQTLKSEISKKEAPTIFQINGPKGYAAWKDYCLDLKNTELYKHLTDKDSAIREGDGVYGIPYVVEGYGIIYNEEITDKYFALTNRQRTVNSMGEIKSFAALKTVVEDMTAHKAEIGIDGVFAVTSLKSGEDWRWQTHLANLPVYYEFAEKGIEWSADKGTDTVDFKYAQNFKNVFDLYIQNSTVNPKLLGSYQVADSMAEFAMGKCAMVQNGNWAYSQISGVSGNTVKADKIKYLPIYTGIPGEENQGLAIGTENYLAINKNATQEQQKLAADFLYWLYSSEKGKEFVTKKLDFIAPFDTFSENDRVSDPLGREVGDWMAREGVSSVPWAFTVFPGQNFKSDFGAALLRYCQGTLSWEDVVKTFKTRWAEEA